MTVLFTGDSITDASRDRTDPTELGLGYVAGIATRLPHERVLNTGVSGNRIRDLRVRWERDVLVHRPDVLSIMVGVNDMWRRYLDDDPTPAADFEADYRHLLDTARASGVVRVLVMEPFLVPIEPTQWEWRADFDEKIAVLRRLAQEYDAQLVATDGPLAQAASRLGPTALVRDGVHPTGAGHALLAELWLAAFDPVRSGHPSGRD